MFKGSNTALITPFRNGKVDEKAFLDLVENQIAAGTHGLVPCGTTGESPTLSPKEHERIITLCVEAAGSTPVIAGCGTNSTEKTIALSKQAEAAGASGLLIVCPYYNKPTQEGLFQHFLAVANSTGLPIIIYNIPGRTAVDMSVETMARLYEASPRIVGVKDATGSVDRVKAQTEACGEDFIQLCGDDILALDFNRLGGRGCVSVTSNIAPGLCAEFQNLCLDGNFDEASKIADRLEPLHKGLFVETNPVPVKFAASLMGLCAPDVRLPLVQLEDASKQTVKAALEAAGIAG